MEIQGTIIERTEVQHKTQTFSLQEFFLDCSTYNQQTGERWENVLKFQVTNDKMNLLAQFQNGQRVKVRFNIQGSFFEHEGQRKHAQRLTVFGIEAIQIQAPQAQYQQPMQQYQQAPQGYVQQPQYAQPAYPPQGQPQYHQGQMFNNYGQAPSQGDGIPY